MILDINDILQIMSSALPEKGCVYLSTPITGGMYRLDHPNDIDKVIQHNAQTAIAMEKEITNDLYYDSYGPIINPARTFISHFSQSQYLKLWKSVIEKFVSRLWLMPDFHFSSGCVEEAAFAYQQDIPVILIKRDFYIFDDGCVEDELSYDERLPREDFIKLVSEAIPFMEEVGLCTKSHEGVLRDINV